MFKFPVLTIFGFLMTEIISYLLHRFIFHGILWRVHQTHHQARNGRFEMNDVFSLIFAFAAMFLMIFAEKPLTDSIVFPIGLGVALFDVLYFIVHDFFTHRRFFPFKSESKVFLLVRAAHQRHHQSIEKRGNEPFGLLIFNYKKFQRKL